MYAVEQAPRELSFGRQGESNILSYEFDFSEWADDWPGGEAEITVILPYETQAQPIPDTQAVTDGNVITLHVLDNLTAKHGRGTMIIRYTAGDNKKRSRLIEFTVDRGHDTQVGNAPSLIEDWVTRYKLLYDVSGTRQEATFDVNFDLTQIVHTDIEMGEVVRTDVFAYDGAEVTQTRTLASGESVVIVTDIDTMTQTISGIEGE